MTPRRVAAYTLTEMLVVLVTIGLLAAIVGPRLFSRLDGAGRARAYGSGLEEAVDALGPDVVIGVADPTDGRLDASLGDPYNSGFRVPG